MQNNSEAALNDYNRALLLKNDKYPEVFLERGMLYKSTFEKDKTKTETRESAISDFRNAITLATIPAVRSQAEQLLEQLAGPTAQPSPEPPHIFIHYNDPGDESVIAQVANDIHSADIFLEGMQPSQGFTTGDIRYYYPEDKKSADNVRKIVTETFRVLGRNLVPKLRFLGNYYKDVPRGSIEVWIPSLSSLEEPPESLRIEGDLKPMIKAKARRGRKGL